jgi:hemerythrin-like domain-containing protein
MKRHPRLRPLSDDHHRALVLARRVRKSREPGAIWPDVVARFASELEPHFQEEERWLFPLLDSGGAHALAAQARADHARLRELIRAEVTRDSAAELAALLERHVRFEERELFPRVELALAAYDDAKISGLCHEGAWEAATGALRAYGFKSVAARKLPSM